MVSDQESLAETEPPRKRGKLAFRLAIGVLLVAGMVYGWSAMGRQKARKQAEAIEAVRAVGGRVEFDYQWQTGRFNSDARPVQPNWMRSLFGAEFFDRAVVVNLPEVERPVDAMDQLALMPYLVRLDVSGSPVGDENLKSIRSIVGLTHLDLSATAVTDEGISYLARLSNLTSLSLASTSVSDKSVDLLADFRQLRHLDLSGTAVSREGVDYLEKAAHAV